MLRGEVLRYSNRTKQRTNTERIFGVLKLNKLMHNKLYIVNIVRTDRISSKLLYFHLSKRLYHSRTNNKRMFSAKRKKQQTHVLHLLHWPISEVVLYFFTWKDDLADMNTYFAGILRDCKFLMTEHSVNLLLVVNRNANRVADYLARLAFKFVDKFWLSLQTWQSTTSPSMSSTF